MPILTLLRPFFRYSQPRRAYVLRLLGDRHGPVLVPRRNSDGTQPRGARR